MAGVGEASAIIAIAQVGIKVSKTIFEYASEVGGAQVEISRIGREMCTTSERLEEIGRLIDQNPSTQLFSERGIASAVRCSRDCTEIIGQVTGLLAKSGWNSDPETLEKTDLDIGLVESLRWPFVRRKLASPQADLDRVKASLSLLFNSVMANMSTNPMQSEYALQIPKLKKWAEQAALKADRERSKFYAPSDSGRRQMRREVHWSDPLEDDDDGDDDDDDDPDLRQSFVRYQIQRIKEEEDRKIEERSAYNLAKEEAKRKAEDENRRLIEQEAIDKYKKEQENILAERTKRASNFKEDLAKIGLDQEKIQSIIDSQGFKALEQQILEQSQSQRRTSQAHEAQGNLGLGPSESPRAEPEIVASKFNPRSWRLFGRSHSEKKGILPPSSVRTADEALRGDVERSPPSSSVVELWLLDLVSGDTMKLAPSQEWLDLALKTSSHDDVLYKMTKLQHPWRTAISNFLLKRNENEPVHSSWQLCLVHLPRRIHRIAIFGHRRRDCLVRLVICQSRLFEGAGYTDIAAANKQELASLPRAISHQARTFTKETNEQSSGPESVAAVEKRIRLSQPAAASEAKDFQPDEGEILLKVEVDIVDGEVQRATTTFPSKSIPPSAIIQLGLPWTELPGGSEEKSEMMTRIPEALTSDEIEKLEAIMRAKMLDGEVPWSKRPSIKTVFQETEYSTGSTPRDRSNSLHEHTSIKPLSRQNSRSDSNMSTSRSRSSSYKRPSGILDDEESESDGSSTTSDDFVQGFIAGRRSHPAERGKRQVERSNARGYRQLEKEHIVPRPIGKPIAIEREYQYDHSRPVGERSSSRSRGGLEEYVPGSVPHTRGSRGSSKPISISTDISRASGKRQSPMRMVTPGPPSRSASRRSTVDSMIEPGPGEDLEQEHDSDSESKIDNIDVISSALGRFTTFEEEAKEGKAQSLSIGTGFPEASQSSALQTLTFAEANRRFEALVEEQKSATRAGDMAKAADLQFYAIPEVRARVEELKAQKGQAKIIQSDWTIFETTRDELELYANSTDTPASFRHPHGRVVKTITAKESESPTEPNGKAPRTNHHSGSSPVRDSGSEDEEKVPEQVEQNGRQQQPPERRGSNSAAGQGQEDIVVRARDDKQVHFDMVEFRRATEDTDKPSSDRANTAAGGQQPKETRVSSSPSRGDDMKAIKGIRRIPTATVEDEHESTDSV